jgi:hypothetical protein
MRITIILNLPSLANPKSVSFNFASSAVFSKSKFSGLRSPINIENTNYLFQQQSLTMCLKEENENNKKKELEITFLPYPYDVNVLQL